VVEEDLRAEPDFASTLLWLDCANDDDRILAGFIEVMRQHPRCPVFLVTGDINLTNKADSAGLPCLAPPEPPGGPAGGP
jgi:predicted ribonuclease YlaK